MTTSASPATISVKPVAVPAPQRGDDVQVRVSAPITGEDLPVVILSHGFGWSMDAYAPLVDAWSAAGLVVIQPTHLDSRTLGLASDDPRFPDIWRTRVADLTAVVDHLDELVAAVPGLAGRVDAGRIAVAGHSWGAQSASMLLGARVVGADGQAGEDLTDARVRAGVLLSLTGDGDSLTPFAAEHLSFMRPDFSAMTAPALIVAGDHDDSPLSTRGPDWFTDGYTRSTGPKSLLTMVGAEHILGGISGYAVAETTDEDPQRVAVVQRATTAYLLDALGVDQDAWPAERAALEQADEPLGGLQSRS